MQTQTLEQQIAAHTLAGDAAGLAALYAADALVDINVPQWRYQVTGAAVEPILREDFDATDRRVTASRVTKFGGGVTVETESRASEHGQTQMWREIHLFRTRDGRIVEHTIYCTGVWDAETIARQATEASMVRR